MRRPSWGCSVRVCLLALSLFALATSAEALEVKRSELPSGLVIVHAERHSLPIVMLTLLIKASPLDDPPGKAGLANLTAKLLTEGTVKRTALEISSEVEYLGASLSTAVNHNYTAISLSVLKKDAAKGFELLSDVVLNPVFPEDEVRRKRDLIKGALVQREEDPSFVAEKRFLQEVFGDHAYGRQVDGTAESLGGLTREDVLAFYRKHYSPGRAVLSVAGDLTSAQLDNLLAVHMADWSKARSSVIGEGAVKSVSSTASLTGPRTVVIDRDVTQANIILGHGGISRENPDYYAVSVMNYILGGGGFASRLMRVVRDEMGLTYGISSVFVPNKEPGPFYVEVQTKNESAGKVITEILRQMAAMKADSVSDQELADAKSFLKGSFPRRLETTRKIADFLTAVQFFSLGDDYVEKYPGYIDRVTKEDVQRVARKYLDTENYRLVVVGKEKDLRLPDPQALQQVR